MDAEQEYIVMVEALLLEHWLRFCFLVEREVDAPGLKLEVPENRRGEVAQLRPALLPLLDCLNGREPDAEEAYAAVAKTAEALLGRQATARVLADTDFRKRVARLQDAIREQAAALPEDISFAEWLHLFAGPVASGDPGRAKSALGAPHGGATNAPD